MEKRSSSKTIYKPVDQYARRPFDDGDDNCDDDNNLSVPALWPQGSEYKRAIVSWPIFLAYWTRNFPCIKKVRKKELILTQTVKFCTKNLECDNQGKIRCKINRWRMIKKVVLEGN